MSKELEFDGKDDYATPSDSYWQKRCEAAEALIKKHYKIIPDSPTYMDWQNTIEPDPESREEGKGRSTNPAYWAATDLYPVYPITKKNIVWGEYIEDMRQSFLRGSEWQNTPAPVTDKGVDVKFYLRKEDPVSDAVENKNK